jgi:RNA polymerase sigma-70 factor, ECF subfamily
VSPREDVDVTRHQRFERVFAEVYEPLQRYVRRRAGSAAVDDVLADTMLVVWRRLDVVAAEAELAWCYGAARRCLANHHRAEERRHRLAARVASQPELSDGESPGYDPDLFAALGELSADDRELVRLWAWEQLAPRELAVVFGISANAASIRLHRAKQRLAERLDARKSDGSTGHKPVGDHTGQRGEGG